jgi:hypothetical protein
MATQIETVVFYLAAAQSSEAEGMAVSMLQTSFRVIVVPMGSPDRDSDFPGATYSSAMSRDLIPGPMRSRPMIHHD